jgi:hypothetical protein
MPRSSGLNAEAADSAAFDSYWQQLDIVSVTTVTSETTADMTVLDVVLEVEQFVRQQFLGRVRPTNGQARCGRRRSMASVSARVIPATPNSRCRQDSGTSPGT